MIYFFHHYELPVIIQQAQVQQILRLRTRQRHQQQNGNGAAGATNNTSNMRNGTNAGNQANNDAMGNNQMNNNGNNLNNNNHRNGNLFTSRIPFILNFQMAMTLFNHAFSLLRTLQGRLTNDVLGTATLFNNNNDNRLNNNNNNRTANITRLRINLSRLRRINLAGIQINPIQINPADDAENIRPERDETMATDGSVMTENSTGETSDSHGNGSDHTTIEDHLPEGTQTDFQLHHQISNDIKTNANLEHTFEPISNDDFDIIDANDEIDIKSNNDLTESNVTNKLATENTLYSQYKSSEGETSFDCDIQIQSIDSKDATIDNAISNHLPKGSKCCTNAMNSISLINTENDEIKSQSSSLYQAELNGQKKSLEDFSIESHNCIQGDKEDCSIINANNDICTELNETNTCTSQTLTLEPGTFAIQKPIEINTPKTTTTTFNSNATENILTTITNRDEQIREFN